jgi:multiple sugar transport system substrate-binding protein
MSDFLTRRWTRRTVLRTGALLGLGASATSLLAACGGPSPAGPGQATAPAAGSAGPVEINWFVGRDVTEANRNLLETFHARQDKIRINWQEQPPSTTEQHDKYKTVLAAKDASIDVFALDIPFVPEFASAQWLTPLDDLFDRADLDKFFPGTVAGATYEGKLWAIPWWNNAAVHFYRKDLLDAASVKSPTTYDELIEAASQLKTPDMDAGFTWQGAQYEGGAVNFFEYLWGHGGEFFNDKGEVVVDSEAGLKALQLMVDLVHKYQVTPIAVTTWKEDEARNVFIEGKAIFERGWIGDFKHANSEGSKVIGKVWMTPHPAAPGQKGQSVLGTWNLAIPKFSQHVQQAVEFIRFMTSEEAMKTKYLVGGQIPPRKAVFDDAEVKQAYSYIDVLKPVFEQARPRPVRSDYGQISAEAIQPNLTAALVQQKTPEAALKDMASKAREIAPR